MRKRAKYYLLLYRDENTQGLIALEGKFKDKDDFVKYSREKGIRALVILDKKEIKYIKDYPYFMIMFRYQKETVEYVKEFM